MKRGGWCILLLLLVFGAHAQNLVPNGSFEQFYKCPGSYSIARGGKIAPGWVSPSTGTPDQFHSCSIGEAGVPTNWAGRSKAFSGSGYAGLYLYIHDREKPYREYLQAEFTAPLVAGVKYQVEFYYKLSSNSKYSIDRIGFLISDSSYQIPDDGVFPKKPTYQRVNREIYNHATGYWTRFGFAYEAMGGERFITIGNFSNDQETRHYFISASQSTEPLLRKAAYFFVDQVKVVAISDPPKVPAPPVLSDYGEVITDKDYILYHIQFGFDEHTLMTSSYTELNQVVEILNYHKEWKAVVSGHTDDIGSEAYNLDLSLKRAGSVSDYLIGSGIDPVRIKSQGFGKLQPLKKGNDEQTRAVNRRVEIRFIRN